MSRGMTPRALAEEAAIEAAVTRHEATRHVAHLRLLAQQLLLWTPEQSARTLNRLADDYARKFEDVA